MNQIEFKKNIKLDNDLAWLIGFYLAEGTKTKGYIGVANNELNLITKSLDLFEKSFGINKNSWTIWIMLLSPPPLLQMCCRKVSAMKLFY